MRIGIWGGAVAVLALAQAASAQTAGTTLTIAGTSTVRSWTCEATAVTMAPNPAKGFEAGVLEGDKALQSVTVTVPVAEIDCGNGTMDDHLRKALKAGAHPEVTYTLSTYELQDAENGVTVASQGHLTIAGQERPISMDVTVSADAAGGLRVKGEHVIDMTDFGVKPPKLMLGTLKVGDTVKVSFDMPLKRLPAALATTNGHN